MSVIALIPARYHSSRLMGKPLLKFGDKTMIQSVYIRTNNSKLIDTTYVVTDDERIKKSIEDINGNVLMVTDDCENGTERICKALKLIDISKVKYVVNVQGDEPYIDTNNIDKMIKGMLNNNNNDCVCTTLHYKITNMNELSDKSIGKLVLDKNSHIMYCSRNKIPENKQSCTSKNINYYGHIGSFIFDVNYLDTYIKENTPLQLEEDIEWLKILEQGYKIKSIEVNGSERGVNNLDDYKYLFEKYSLGQLIYIDIDGTICNTNGMSYELSTPIHDCIENANKLYDKGNYIVYWTARGSKTGIDWYKLTENQLKEWGVKYHELHMKKPPYDIFICDKSVDSLLSSRFSND